MAEPDNKMIPAVSSRIGANFRHACAHLRSRSYRLVMTVSLSSWRLVGLRQSHSQRTRGRPPMSRAATMYRAASMLWSLAFTGSSFSPPALPGFTAHT
ncbi:hypothetical protein SAMN04490357_1035 [Streptomyces misionensis]|uniref:Uncharacterized protein n=1 Tax=Streptomyces misionensis TaxID=67331 RepID=A0A1H4PA29_9ACTN|nr:hypothetical protein SAMN04490357_1035 [Streptomyces misionensis]